MLSGINGNAGLPYCSEDLDTSFEDSDTLLEDLEDSGSSSTEDTCSLELGRVSRNAGECENVSGLVPCACYVVLMAWLNHGQ